MICKVKLNIYIFQKYHKRMTKVKLYYALHFDETMSSFASGFVDWFKCPQQTNILSMCTSMCMPLASTWNQTFISHREELLGQLKANRGITTKMKEGVRNWSGVPIRSAAWFCQEQRGESENGGSKLTFFSSCPMRISTHTWTLL